MRAIALKLMVTWGWRRAVLCLLAGALSALAMEPFSLFPVLFITIPLLVWTLDGVHAQAESRGHAFRAGFSVGWLFGFGYFLAGVHWVGSAFLVDSDSHAWMMPPVLLFFTMALALFWGVGCGLAAAIWTRGLARLLVLAAALAATEWLRGVVLTGFPWNTPGLAVAGSDQLSQIAGYVGLSGLNLIVLLIAGAPALLADEPSRKAFGGYGNALAAGGLFAALAGLWGVGHYVLSNPVPAHEEATRIRIVQPNIPQKEKWVPENRSRIFASYLEFSDAATSPEVTGIDDVDVLIWPESAPPFLIEQHPDALASIAALLPDGAILLTGALRAEQASAGQSNTSAERRVYNSVLAIDSSGSVIAHYDKVHLVPFGEYLPLESRLGQIGIRKLVKLPGSFSAGLAAQTISITGVPPFSALICYEIIFARSAVDHENRPKWLLNVTNDAWFGDSAGPRQHLQQARFRAIEQGLPVVRSANTGISAAIDARGRILAHKPIGVGGVIDIVLPGATEPTFYAVYGDWALVLLIVCSLAASALLRTGSEKQRNLADPHTDFTAI